MRHRFRAQLAKTEAVRRNENDLVVGQPLIHVIAKRTFMRSLKLIGLDGPFSPFCLESDS
jgi:hypothetical protein